MKGIASIVSIAVLSAAGLVAAQASPITYSFSGTGSGTITDSTGAQTTFSDASFNFTFTGNTMNVQSDPIHDPGYYRLFNVGGTFSEGTFTATLSPTVTLVSSAAPSLELINFFNHTFDNGLGGQNAGLDGYTLATAIGPLALNPLTPTLNGGSFAISGGGGIEMTSDRTLSFTASVPEPTTFALLGFGLLALAYQRRRVRSCGIS